MDSYGLQETFEQQVAIHFCSDKLFFHLFQEFVEPDLLGSEQAKLAFNTAKTVYGDINDAPGATSIVLNRASTQVNQGKLDITEYCNLVDYLSEPVNTDPKVVSKELAPILKERARHVALIKGVEDKANRRSLSKVAAYIEKIEKIGEYVEGRAPLSLDDDSLFDALAKMSNLDRLATGVDELDLCLSGGLPRGNLGVIIGRPGGGKSVSLCQLASYAYATGKIVAHVVISEIPGEIGGARVLAPIVGLKISDITRDVAAAKEAWKLYRKDHAVGGYHVFDFPSKVPVSVVRETVMEFYRKLGTKPDIIAFDYLGLASSNRAPKNANGYTMGEFTTGELRDWAKEEQLYIWTAAQSIRLKQHGRGSRAIIGLDDIADSYHVVRIADIVITINTVESKPSFFESQFFIAKHRVGPSGQLTSMAPVDWDTGTIAPCSLFSRQRQKIWTSPTSYVN